MQRLLVGHVGLNVKDLARSSKFYQEVFGFRTVLESKDGDRPFALLGDGERVVLTLWQQSRDAFQPSRAGLHHLAFQVSSLDEVRRYEALLRSRGVSFAYPGVVAHAEGADSGGIYFHDPDGIRLEIFTETGARELPAPVPGAPACGFF